MSRFDLHPVFDGTYLLDVQSDLIDIPSTRMMVPMISVVDAPQGSGRLFPRIEIEGKQYVMASHLMGAVPKSALAPPVGNALDQAEAITLALDMLFFGF